MNVKTTLRTKVVTWVRAILKVLTGGRLQHESHRWEIGPCWTIYFTVFKLRNSSSFYTILVGKSTSSIENRYKISCALWTRKTGDTSTAKEFNTQRTTS